MSVGKLTWKAIGSTDIGGGKENQDDYFVWENPSRGLMVTGVLDGHGRDVGKVAAMVGKDYLMRFCENNQDQLESNTFDFLVNGIVEAHQAIKEGFMKALSDKGFEVKETAEGYLVKRKRNKSQWVCVHGGTSCSLVAIVGTKLYTGNVGDSTGIMSASKPILSDNMLQFVGDSGDVDRKTSSMEQSGTGAELSNTLVITSDHSPESPVEFKRMRSFRASEKDPKQPALQVVYDASLQDKSKCPSVFELDASDCPIVTNRGSYYKNVRREWASLVAAPTNAKYQDALAFTRSIGDFHLHIYGVSERPEVHCVDLQPVLAALAAAGAYRASRSPTSPTQQALPPVGRSGKAGGGTTATATTEKGVSPVSPKGRGGLSPMRISPMEDATVTDGVGNVSGSGRKVSPCPSPSSSSSSSSSFSFSSSDQQNSQSQSRTRVVDPTQFPSLCVVLASDGIWDNWEYSDVSDFVMNPRNATSSGGSGSKSGIATGSGSGTAPVVGVDRAELASKALIASNAAHATRNFGDQADNATGVVLFIHPTELPPL